MLSIGTCPTCNAGPLGLRKCGVCRRVVVLCDECDAAWPDQRTSQPGTRGAETMPCPHCRSNLWASGASWATRDEAAAAEWLAAANLPLTESESIEPSR